MIDASPATPIPGIISGDDNDLVERSPALRFLRGGGEATRLILHRDWSDHPLGAPMTWPSELKVALSLVLSSPESMILCWGRDELSFFFNETYIPLLGPRVAWAMGSRFDQVWADGWEQAQPIVADAYAGRSQRFVDLPWRLGTDRGQAETWFTFSYSRILDAEGEIAGLFILTNETTDRVLADAEARASRERLQRETERQRQSLQQMPGFVAILAGPTHVFEYVNDAYVAMVGARDFVGRTVRQVFPELDEQDFYTLLDTVYASGTPFTARAIPLRLAGEDEDRFIDLLYQPIRDDGDAVTGIFAGGYDVSEQVRAERRRDALLELDDRLRDVVETAEVSFVASKLLGETLAASCVGYGAVDPDAGTVTIERNWCASGDESLAGVHRFSGDVTCHADLRRGLPIANNDVTTDPRTGSGIATLPVLRVGAFLDVPVLEGGKVVGELFVHTPTPRIWNVDDIAFVRDFAERTQTAIARRRAEQSLREQNDLLEATVAERTRALLLHKRIIESDVTAICAFDTDYRLIAFNKAHNDEFFRANGFYTKLGDVFWALFVPEQQALMKAQMERALTGDSFSVEEEFGDPEIEAPRWEIHYSPLRDETGTVIGAFHHARDIGVRLRAQAELAAAQEALRQSQKMEAMGQLTGGVAHDFNNLLTPIVGTLDLLQRKAVGGEREQRLIEGAAASADRARTLVQRLLAFARRQPLQTIAVDVSKLVKGMADLIESTTGPQIRVIAEAADDLPPAVADPHQLEMALLNLAVNARDAMPDGGTLRITASGEIVHPHARGELKAGRYIRLSVADTGMGMSKETMARAVEPFYSTKGVGKGTGLGLSMVHGLASQLGGALRLSSRPGVGTNVELWLPESKAAVEDIAPRPEPAIAAPRGTALLVDDEEVVRHSTADMLADLGYRVVEAASAEAALALVRGGLTIDLLVTDHLMPGMTGSDLARTICGERGAVPVLIVSGYAESEGIEPDLPRLTKPFRRDELMTSLAALSG